MVCYGHFAEGDAHVNIVTPHLKAELQEKIEKFLFDWIKSLKGSISSEHGLGIQRRDQIIFSKSLKAVEIMSKVKEVFDPQNVLNPYKVLPSKVHAKKRLPLQSQL